MHDEDKSLLKILIIELDTDELFAIAEVICLWHHNPHTSSLMLRLESLTA